MLRPLLPLLPILLAALLSAVPTAHAVDKADDKAAAKPPDKIRFGTNWKAQGGHGGFYQALADGTYRRYGLDVEIVQGGPQVNNRPLLSAGRLDFLMAGNLLHSFDNVKNGIPVVAVAAFFQRDPQILMAHDGVYPTFADLRRARTILIGKDGQFSFWQWLKSEHGMRDEQLRPYTFNLAQFLRDRDVVQQGYASSEPYSAIAAGAKPRVFLLADHGWQTYSTTVETRAELVRTKPELVQRFIDASIIGWYSFLYGDHAPAHALIIDSGDALARGIGAIDTNRVRAFLEQMVKAGLYKPNEVDPARAITDRFVNKGVGLDVRKALGVK
ncbi:MAG TPA: ABC transporter substrate-binding protein [Burkholderiaceae bacterium]|nr:ABC transporter substrate-binding protein [Burkholderiaceae bacterium]